MMRARVRTAVALLALLGASGCVSGFADAPALHVPAPEFRERVRTVCLTTPQSQITLPVIDDRLARIEQLLGDRLRDGGYRVVPSAETTAAMSRALADAGGYYDPHTGDIDVSRRAIVRPQLFQTLHERLGCDAMLKAVVAVVSVPFANGHVWWDGRRETYDSGLKEGWTTGLSLWVAISDLREDELYFHTGGIETIVDLDVGFFGSEFKPTDETQVLTDEARLAQAVELSLAPLLAASPAP